MSEPQDPARLPDLARDPDLFRQILENQASDIFVRQQDQALRKQEIENAHEYALRLLDAQLVDRQQEREHNRNVNNNGCIVVMGITLLIIAATCYALYLNKDQLVMEFLKAAIYLLTGGLGGYSIKTIQSKKSEPKE